MSIELHCHSLFSVDGFGTPEDIVDIAAENGVGTLSITDHNSLGGAERAARRAAERGVRYLTGIEMDAFFREHSYHFLGFGFDPSHAGLNALAARNYGCYPYRFEMYFKQLKELGFPWEREALEAHLAKRYPTHPAPVLSTFLVRDFLQERGEWENYADMRKEAMDRISAEDRYSRPGPDEEGRFCRFEDMRDAVRDAGGVVLLSHVGKVLADQPDAQEALIRDVVGHGADGFELYHPANFGHADMDRLAALGRELDCLMSGGSDCHRAPTAPHDIGSCGAPVELADRLVEAVESRIASQRGAG